MIITDIGATIPPGASGYCDANALPNRSIQRQWKYRGMRRSVQWRGGGVVKVADAFQDHRSPEQLAALLTEAEERGVNMPSSYADLFHRKWYAPPIRRSHAKMFQGAVRGGWIQVLTPDIVREEPLFYYDIRSAYLGATACGLPDPGSFRVVKKYCGPGVYWVRSPVRAGYPYPWYREGVFPASSEEIEFLCLKSCVVGKGLAFEPDTYDAGSIVGQIKSWSAYKAIGRSFWGRWAAADGPTMETLDADGKVKSVRALPPLFACPTWAVIITSRVRLRIAEQYDKGGVLLTLTDAIVTTREIPTGDEIGDWREVARFPQGGTVTMGGVSAFAA